MKSKMCGLSVALLIFACFLSSCSTPQFGPPSASDPGSTKRGNCLEVTGVSGGTPYDYCYYTFSKPMCTTAVIECRNITGKCSTTNPVPNPPPC